MTYDDGLSVARVVRIEDALSERRKHPICPTCKGPNSILGIVTAWFPYCSPWCEEKKEGADPAP